MSEDLNLVKVEDLSMVDNCFLNEEQLKILLRRTPKTSIKKRIIKIDGNDVEFDYVSGGYVIKILNILFGWDWDFEIISYQVYESSAEVIVNGKLTCRSDGRTIIKNNIGSSRVEIRFKKPINLGNALKSAATDSLKKCASLIGIASDVYNKEEFKEVTIVEEKPSEQEEESTLEILSKLFIDKSKYLEPEDRISILRIIENEETNSYKKAIRKIKSLKNN